MGDMDGKGGTSPLSSLPVLCLPSSVPTSPCSPGFLLPRPSSRSRFPGLDPTLLWPGSSIFSWSNLLGSDVWSHAADSLEPRGGERVWWEGMMVSGGGEGLWVRWVSRKGRKGPELAPAGDWEIGGSSSGRERKEGRVCHLETREPPQSRCSVWFCFCSQTKKKYHFRKIFSCPRLFSLFLGDRHSSPGDCQSQDGGPALPLHPYSPRGVLLGCGRCSIHVSENEWMNANREPKSQKSRK